jgi:hypothetical protein
VYGAENWDADSEDDGVEISISFPDKNDQNGLLYKRQLNFPIDIEVWTLNYSSD